MISRSECQARDERDPLAPLRHQFYLPEGLSYLDGNSLGALPVAVSECLRTTLEREWGSDLIGSWNAHDWIGLPERLGNMIAPLIGAASGQVIVADSVSVNLFKLLSAGLNLKPGRTTVLSTTDNFPTDLYMAQGLAEMLGDQRCVLQTVGRAELVDGINETTAIVLLTHVDFRSGRMFDMSELTRAAQQRGALVLWDLSHSVGAVPLTLDADRVDMAVGCGYKYLNGGPGAPAFLYLAERHHTQARQPLAGWMGHADPFAFSPDYTQAPAMQGFSTGTPPVLAYRALEAALAVWGSVSIQQVRRKSVELAELFVALVDETSTLDELELRSPRHAADRGSHVAFAHPSGYSIMQALIDRKVVGDFREPDLLRYGFAPLYVRYVDVWDAVAVLRDVIETRIYEAPRYSVRGAVT